MRHSILTLVLFAPTTLLCPLAARAQTRFTWPDTSEHVAHYSNLENCLAAADRVRSSVLRREDLSEWRDTLPQNPQEALEPAAAQVTQTASACAAQFAEAKVDVHDFAPAMKLFLLAGRDSDAAQLVQRRVAAAPAKASHERGAVVDSAVDIYVNARPSRLESAEALLSQRVRTSADRVERLKTYATMLRAAKNAGDTARSVRIARRLVGVADSLTVAERQSDEYERMLDGMSGDLYVYDAVDVITGIKTRMDSLRKSTQAYAALERGNWSLATGERPEALQMPIGHNATALTADFWYPANVGTPPRPTRGRVALVLFLEHTDCISEPSQDDAGPSVQCAGRMAELRRLAKRFPEMEIDIIASTHGQFMYLPPTSPTDEAALIKDMVDSYRVTGAALGITSTPFWRLPSPDDRRIDKDRPNYVHYSFGKSWKVGSGSMFLVDQDGLIADAWRLREEELGQFIEVLLQRQAKGN